MAEIIGATASCLTSVSLFKVCIHGFDIIHTFRSQEQDLNSQSLKLVIEQDHHAYTPSLERLKSIETREACLN